MDVFFVLSGYVLMLVYAKDLPFSITTFRNYILQRFARIVPLSFIVTIIYFATFLLISSSKYQMNTIGDISITNLIGNIFLLDSVIPGFTSIVGAKWSVSVEVIAYIFVFPLLFLLKISKNKLLCAYIIVVLMQFLFWDCLDNVGRLFSRCLPEFILGAIIYFYTPYIKKPLLNNILFVLGALGFIFLPDRLQTVPCSLIVISALNDNSTIGRILSSRILYFLGEISYSLYLWHGMFVIMVAGVFKLFPMLGLYYIYWIVIPVLLSILVGYLSFKYIEVPCRKIIRNW